MTDESAASDTAVSATVSEVTPIAVFYEAAARLPEAHVGAFNALGTKAWNALSIGSVILPITLGLPGISGVGLPLRGALAFGQLSGPALQPGAA